MELQSLCQNLADALVAYIVVAGCGGGGGSRMRAVASDAADIWLVSHLLWSLLQMPWLLMLKMWLILWLELRPLVWQPSLPMGL